MGNCSTLGSWMAIRSPGCSSVSCCNQAAKSAERRSSSVNVRVCPMQLNAGLSAKRWTASWNTSINERSEEHTSELQSRGHLVCRLLLEKKNNKHSTEHR